MSKLPPGETRDAGSRLAVSNIAWEPSDDDAIRRVLQAAGVSGIEVAPTKRWPAPDGATVAEADAYRQEWSSHGLSIVASQSLLFGRADLKIFGDERARADSLAYLTAIIRLCGRLGARALVFGSPSNRRVDDLAPETIRDIAVPFFRRLGEVALAAGTAFCIEPNPPQYGCDFLTDTRSAVEFLETVGAVGLGLHLDAAAMTLNGENADESCAIARPWLRHFHISEPFLAPLGSSTTDHAAIARALARIEYGGWCSIEMRASLSLASTDHVARAVEFARAAYAPVLDA